MKKYGFLNRESTGNIIIDHNGYVPCVIEDESIYQLKFDEIDFSQNTLSFTVDNTEIIIDLFKSSFEETQSMGNKENDQNENTSVSFLWTDATTKLFLDIYKRKKDLVNTRKIKTYKHLWKNIAEEMLHSGYAVTPLQVENKFKSLMRSYKNMVSNNKKTGRARTTCKYET
ncbi:hypothetical protein ALC62_10887 [Cyphomyrmex costatus]|uniref:Myb/SANT-like DNA-binding domain-containing protein n=1 Tax=Cyphomyrmex costatus TaxID=456900 RepID=A0A151IDC5_9HYME|nr:hypothetical protein ALC62_10887 [Cyphomyrmex costatus]